jgi:hypothetical protein
LITAFFSHGQHPATGHGSGLGTTRTKRSEDKRKAKKNKAATDKHHHVSYLVVVV